MEAIIKVLIVDETALARVVITKALETDPRIKVVGAAANGKIALSMIRLKKPDVVILDYKMPETGGLETAVEIDKKYPHLSTIMFSKVSESTVPDAVQAMLHGVLDVVAKPEFEGDQETDLETIKNILLPKILAIGRRKKPYRRTRVLRKSETEIGIHRISAIGIGVSTGGPQALKSVIPALPKNIEVPIFIVQHMLEMFVARFVSDLNAISEVEVKVGESKERVKPGTVYVAPGDHHMYVVKRGKDTFIKTDQVEKENHCRPAVDPLFRSLAQVYGRNTLALVMTGMGSDGLEGCRTLSSENAQIIVQDEETSVVWGMAGAVSRASLARETLPLDEIASYLKRSLRI